MKAKLINLFVLYMGIILFLFGRDCPPFYVIGGVFIVAALINIFFPEPPLKGK